MNKVEINPSQPNSSVKNDRKIVEIKNLIMSFFDPVTKSRKLVLDNVSFDVYQGNAVGIIGESGSGKTVLTSLLTGTFAGSNAIIESGSILIDGQDVTNFTDREWGKAKILGLVVGQVFQNPMSTLNPYIKVGDQLTEALRLRPEFKDIDKAYAYMEEMLRKVKITDPKHVMNLYPFELSGGMSQRVALATILALKPKIIILDEPTTALDTTVQAELLEVIKEIKRIFDVTFIYISHDIGVIASICDTISIMYAGRIIESGLTQEILFNPQHPYAWGLLQSMPESSSAGASQLWSIPGAVPSDISNVKGDSFAPRNAYAMQIDFEKHPPMYQISPTHFAATWLLDKSAPPYKPPQAIQERWNRFKQLKGIG